MNILVHEISEMTKLIQLLTNLDNTSIYLSVSQSDTLRILEEIKPDAVIFQQSCSDSFIKEISGKYPRLVIYLYKNGISNHSQLKLKNYRNFEDISLKKLQLTNLAK